MEKIRLKKTELEVSKIALGTADYGTKYSAETAFEQMDVFSDGGGNFLDTACVYGSWIPGLGNISEQVIGDWFKARGKRNQMVISTKGAHPEITNMEQSRVSPQEIEKDIEASLRALKTDYIDMYFLHRDNPEVPVEVLLECLEKQQKKGNLRYYGCSNWKLPRIIQAQEAAKREDYAGFVCNQLMYSLAVAKEEKLWDPSLVMLDHETYENHVEAEWNVMAYMAAAKGYLVKKMRGMSVEPNVEEAYGNEDNNKIIAYLKEIEQEGFPAEEVSLAYLMNQSLTVVPVVSFRNREQLEAALRSCERKFPKEIFDKLREIRGL